MNFKALFHNCLDVEQKGEEYFPVRFTSRQFAFYQNTKVAQFPLRAVQSAGITLEFYTDAEEVHFDYTITCVARDWIAFDVFENGIFTDTVRMQDRRFRGTFSYQKRAKDEVKLVIHLSPTADIHISHMELGNWKPVPRREKKYLALGDSITQGMECTSPSITFTNFVKEHLDAEILNQGIGGFWFDSASLDEKLPFVPDLITVNYGSNDAASTMDDETIRVNVAAYLKRVKEIYTTKPIFVITPIWRNELVKDPAFRVRFERIRGWIAENTAKQGLSLINGMEAVPNNCDYYKDGFLHPNNLGHALFGLYVIKHLQVK
jgi:lysophospholipase L1-like esterase